MKEATGELNMTVITVVAIAAVAAFFYAFVWPQIQNSIAGNAACSNGPGTVTGVASKEGYVSCTAADATTGTYTCSYYTNGETRSTTCTRK